MTIFLKKKYYQIWCTLNSDDLEVMHMALSKRIQSVITTKDGVTKCKITCQLFAGNEINFKINCFVVTVLYMCFNKTWKNNDLHLLNYCKTKLSVHRVCK